MKNTVSFLFELFIIIVTCLAVALFFVFIAPFMFKAFDIVYKFSQGLL